MSLDNIKEIMASLPHRYPFLLVDRVLEVRGGNQILAIKNVTLNEPQFQGHFPGHPIMPGVLILEALAQASAILARHIDESAVKGRLVYFMAIDKARFRKPVLPGDQMVLDCTLLKRRQDIWRFAARALTDNEVAAEAEIMAMTRD
ncbi:MAG: 3-hydroxyacyl-ACP dehydratase FabZ [Magnetococcus sp. WYHC-3]